MAYVPELTFNMEWNRHALCAHASFSDSHNHYMSLTSDYWEKPGKFYKDNVLGSEFFIYFTTDGIHKLQIINGDILMELSFVLRTNRLT